MLFQQINKKFQQINEWFWQINEKFKKNFKHEISRQSYSRSKEKNIYYRSKVISWFHDESSETTN